MRQYNPDDILSAMHSMDIYNDISSFLEMTENNRNNIGSDVKNDMDLIPLYAVLKGYVPDAEDSIDKLDDDQQKYAFLNKSINKLSNGDNLTHAAISIKSDLSKMYSYDLATSGFKIETINDSTWDLTSHIHVSVVFVSSEAFDKIKGYIKELISNPDSSAYATSNFITQWLSSCPTKADKRFICSTFVAYLLGMSDPKNLHRDYSRLKPEDISLLPRSFFVLRATDRKDLISKIPSIGRTALKIYTDNKDELIDYNNHLPKLLLSNKFGELKTFDKIINYFTNLSSSNKHVEESYDSKQLLVIFDQYNESEIIPEINDGDEDEKDLYPIYVLNRSNFGNITDDNKGSESDRFGKLINDISGDKYSHSVISFDDTFTDMYSYELQGGFVSDSIIDNPIWQTTTDIYLTVMFINKKSIDKIRDYIEYLKDHQSETSYATSNLLTTLTSKNPTKADKRMVCSTFVAYLLGMSDPKNLHRDYSRLRPEDVTILPRAFYVINVRNADELNQNIQNIKNRVASIRKEHEDELMDYNNHLPRILLSNKFTELKKFDKIVNWAVKKFVPNARN